MRPGQLAKAKYFNHYFLIVKEITEDEYLNYVNETIAAIWKITKPLSLTVKYYLVVNQFGKLLGIVSDELI